MTSILSKEQQYYINQKSIINQTYIQSNENTCAFIAILNALSYFNKPIPHINKLRSIAKKYQIQYGASRQDICSISQEFGIYLSSFKPEKYILINAINKGFPVLISIRFKLIVDVLPELKYNIKCIDFKVGSVDIRIFLTIDEEKKIKENNISGNHTILLIEYNKENDKFLCLNVLKNNCWLDYNDFIFEISPDGEKWDTTYLCTTTPIKITGFPL